MDELIETIKNWPMIVQGALGSGLFWLVLLVGQYLVENAINLYSRHSENSRESYLVSKMCKYDAFIKGSAFFLNATIYRSMRFFYKAIMWLILGLLFQQFLSTLSTVGYLGCLYYLLKAYGIISPWNKDEIVSLEHEREKVVAELKSMGKLEVDE